MSEQQQRETTISLEGTPKVDQKALYFIDWSQLTNINDLILIIAALGISMSPTHPVWPQIEHLMDLTNPVIPGGAQPELKEIKLPKLKQL